MALNATSVSYLQLRTVCLAVFLCVLTGIFMKVAEKQYSGCVVFSAGRDVLRKTDGNSKPMSMRHGSKLDLVV